MAQRLAVHLQVLLCTWFSLSPCGMTARIPQRPYGTYTSDQLTASRHSMPSSWNGHVASRVAAQTSLEHIVVVTDPRTDPTEDDAAAVCALVALNLHKPFARSITLLVTGAQGSLEVRYKGIKFLEAFGVKIH